MLLKAADLIHDLRLSQIFPEQFRILNLVKSAISSAASFVPKSIIVAYVVTVSSLSSGASILATAVSQKSHADINCHTYLLLSDASDL